MDKDFGSSFGTQTPVAGGQARNIGEQARNVAGEAREKAREIKDQAREGLDEGRRAMNDVMGDVQAKGRQFVDRARELGNQAKVRGKQAARDIGIYAEDNVTVVAIASLAIGILIGRYLVPESD